MPATITSQLGSAVPLDRHEPDPDPGRIELVIAMIAAALVALVSLATLIWGPQGQISDLVVLMLVAVFAVGLWAFGLAARAVVRHAPSTDGTYSLD